MFVIKIGDSEQDDQRPGEIVTLEYARASRRSAKSVTPFPGDRPMLFFAVAVAVTLLLPVLVFLGGLTGRTECPRSNKAMVMVGPNGPLPNAIDLYLMNCGKYPSDLSDLYTRPTDPELAKHWIQGVKGPSNLLDPWGRPYFYVVTDSATGPPFLLWSAGPNGIDEVSDGDNDFGDDIRSWE